VRNNIIAAGNCDTRAVVGESSNATLRLVENNNLYAKNVSSATAHSAVLYLRSDAAATTIADVNALAGANNNISADPKFANYPVDFRISADSPCIDRGTALGAPTTDADGNPRPAGAGFDMGAYECE
jgi:hypothetical protein